MNVYLTNGIGYAESEDIFVDAGQALTLDVQFVGAPDSQPQVRVMARAVDDPHFAQVTVLGMYQPSLTFDPAAESTVYRLARTEEAVELSVTGEVKSREYSGGFELLGSQLPARFCVAGLGDTEELTLFAVEPGEMEEIEYATLGNSLGQVVMITGPGAYRWRSLAPVRTYLTTS